MVVRSRGIKHPTIAPALRNRLPPGQVATARWPVLHEGSVPPFDPGTWDFRVFGLVGCPLRYTWDEFLSLPRISVTADFHCVSRWSRLDNTWEGVSSHVLMTQADVQPDAAFVLFHCDGGYTANLPVGALIEDDVLFAIKHDGETLTPEHGFPLRAIVPSRYAWKCAKWIRAVEFVAADVPGFWEQFGYHHNADVRLEERFADADR
jgi:DMSO/TMAO reductase YedYZ molybdopterin-dependent catalytic subunit